MSCQLDGFPKYAYLFFMSLLWHIQSHPQTETKWMVVPCQPHQPSTCINGVYQGPVSVPPQMRLAQDCYGDGAEIKHTIQLSAKSVT